MTWQYNGDKFLADPMSKTDLDDTDFEATRLYLLIITMGEGEHICLGSSPANFRRAVLQQGMPAQPTRQFQHPYVFAGHIWPENLAVYHIDFHGGRIAFGPASERISPTAEFINECARIFGFTETCYDVAAVLGGRGDYQWIFNPDNHKIPLPAQDLVPTSTRASNLRILGDLDPLDIPSMLEARLQSLQTEWRKVRPIVVFYLGVGQRTQHGHLSPISATYLDAGHLPEGSEATLHAAFCHLRNFMLARESLQNLSAGFSTGEGRILYSTVSDGYFATVGREGVPAPHRVEPFIYEVLFSVLRGLAYLYLGTPYLPTVTFPGCAGQFQVQLRPEAQATRGVPYQMAVSPFFPHTHYGYRCQGEPYTIKPYSEDEDPNGLPAFRRQAYALDPIRDIRRHVNANFNFQFPICFKFLIFSYFNLTPYISFRTFESLQG